LFKLKAVHIDKECCSIDVYYR